jgi:hypothetical protein
MVLTETKKYIVISNVPPQGRAHQHGLSCKKGPVGSTKATGMQAQERSYIMIKWKKSPTEQSIWKIH